MVFRQPDGQEGAEAKLVQNFVSSIFETIGKIDRMIAPGAVLPEVFRRYTDGVLARIKHCVRWSPARVVGATMVG